MRNVVFDIDGCIADCSHRLHFILREGKKDWPSFDAGIPLDTPIRNMIRLSQVLYNSNYTIMLLTGRNERTRVATADWLHKHGIHYDQLEMRGLNDHRPAGQIKLERLTQLGWAPESVLSVFEDEPKTIRLLREHGYHVCAVDEWEGGYQEVTGGRDDNDE
jgi:hypothetical protein